MVSLNSAEARLDAAKITLKGREKELARLRTLQSQGIVTEVELSQNELDVELASQELEAAKSNLQLIKRGASSGKVSNVVLSTVAGMVIEVPVKEGSSVVETNNFNEGTTIAAVADMTDMIFQGYLDESYCLSCRRVLNRIIKLLCRTWGRSL